MSSHCVATLYICAICSLFHSFIFSSGICDQTNILWVTLKTWSFWWYFRLCLMATHSILIWSQIGERELHEGNKLMMSHIEYVVIRWEFKYLIWVKVVELVLATGPGNPPAAVQFGSVPDPGKTRPALVLAGCYPDRTLNRGFLAGLEPDRSSNILVPAALAPIKYLSCDRIVTWSIRRLCGFRRSFTSHFQICDLTDFRWVVVK